MATSIDNPLLSTWSAALASAGIESADLLQDSTGDAQATASGEALFRWGNLIVRLVRDRGQDFVDIAPRTQPGKYFSLDDVGVAGGWRTVESIVARQDPASLVDELREIVRRRTELESALAPERLGATEAALAEARKRRERAFLDKLKRLAGGH